MNYTKERKISMDHGTPPPICSIIGEHVLNNPTGKVCCRCEHCGKLFKWTGHEWV